MGLKFDSHIGVIQGYYHTFAAVFNDENMRKILLFCLFPVLLFSCGYPVDFYKDYKFDGMWQLKTVQYEDANGNEVSVNVDTIYYSFQREIMFSLTVLVTPEQAEYPFYGYVDILSDDKVRLTADNKNNSENRMKLFLEYSGWSAPSVDFEVIKYNKSDLILFDAGNEKTYTLKKF